jgi:hypothetical protein
LVPEGSAALMPSTVLWHELAHVRFAGPRPHGLLARRLHHVIEEASADYVAAVVAGGPHVGSHDVGELRDLGRAEDANVSVWAELALSERPPSHRLAASLARRFWEHAPAPGPFVVDLARALGDPRPWPSVQGTSATVRELLKRCPERSRTALSDSLAAWMPPELFDLNPRKRPNEED